MLDGKYQFLDERSWRKDRKGYPTINLRQHQLVWLLEYGSLPKPPYSIDHINGDKEDNRIENLRVADPYQQNLNKSGWGQTGFTGVYDSASEGRFRAKLIVRKNDGNKSTVNLGSYGDPQIAAIGRDLGGLFLLEERDVPFLRLNFPERLGQYQAFLETLDGFDNARTAQDFLERFPSWL